MFWSSMIFIYVHLQYTYHKVFEEIKIVQKY